MRIRFVAAVWALLLSFLPLAHAADPNYSDIWWNPQESGWGLTIADHETTMWAVWFTYRQNGTPTWMYMAGGTFTEGKRRFSGDLYQTTGPSYRAAYASRAITNVKVGTASFDFAPPGFAPGVALFNYTVGDVTGSRQIERYGFGNGAPNWGTDFTDIWWDPAESGTGITIAQHGTTAFGVWYTYGDDNQPLFIVLSAGAVQGTGAISGDLATTRGPYFGNATFDSSQVVSVPFGSLAASIERQAAVQSFTPMKGTWNATHADGTAVSKFFTQLGFGNAAPSVAPPPCLVTGTCIDRTPSSSATCSYRTCSEGKMPDGYDSYGYPYGDIPCQCSSETGNLSVACSASRPLVSVGQSCAAGQGCPVGSVCVTRLTGLQLCMTRTDFDRNMCY